MSAIFGLFRFDGQPVLSGDLQSMNTALAMHGPDENGVWFDGHAGLGQRLMRFTPEDNFERQPLLVQGSRLCLVADGRIDNRSELMNELSIPQHEARMMPDSAFILRAYEKWGAESPGHLIGAYAFALYNGRENSLLLARSPRGERSLFYHVSARIFAFSTAPKGLFALPFVPREVNRERIADQLTSNPPDPSTGFFSGIQRLRQGHSILVRPEGLKMVRYWRLNSRREIRFARDRDYVEAFDALLDRVIDDNLRSLTPVGVMMSGGLDSTCIAAVAAERLASQGARLSTFTEVPPQGFRGTLSKGRYADETPYVNAMARKYSNLDLNLVRTDGRFFLDDIERFFRAAEFPVPAASNRPYWEAIHEQSANQRIRVLLTGLVGNFTISWAGLGVMSGLLRRGKWKRAFEEARALSQTGASSSAFRAIARGAASFLPRPVWHGIASLRYPGRSIFQSGSPWHSYSAIRPEFAKQYRVEQRARENGHAFRLPPGTDFRIKLLERDLNGDVPRGHEAMFGVQTRAPANDQRIVEFCLAIPEDQYLRNGTTRWLLRRAMADRLPPEVLANPLRGLQAADWLERFVDAAPRILVELDLLDQCDLAREAIDLPRLRTLTQKLGVGARDFENTGLEIRELLDLGIMTGRFLRWVESGAER